MTRELHANYQSRVPGGRLHVHCVSNEIYWVNRDKPKSKAMPYLKLSGIIEVREHCMSMVSESQYLSAVGYMKNDIPALISDTQRWVQSGSGSMSAERKTKIRNALNVLEGDLKRVSWCPEPLSQRRWLGERNCVAQLPKWASLQNQQRISSMMRSTTQAVGFVTWPFWSQD